MLRAFPGLFQQYLDRVVHVRDAAQDKLRLQPFRPALGLWRHGARVGVMVLVSGQVLAMATHSSSVLPVSRSRLVRAVANHFSWRGVRPRELLESEAAMVEFLRDRTFVNLARSAA